MYFSISCPAVMRESRLVKFCLVYQRMSNWVQKVLQNMNVTWNLGKWLPTLSLLEFFVVFNAGAALANAVGDNGIVEYDPEHARDDRLKIFVKVKCSSLFKHNKSQYHLWCLKINFFCLRTQFQIRMNRQMEQYDVVPFPYLFKRLSYDWSSN